MNEFIKLFIHKEGGGVLCSANRNGKNRDWISIK